MYRRQLCTLFTLAFLGLMLAACNPIKEHRNEKLNKALWNFEQAVRWKGLANAWSFLSVDVKKAYPPPEEDENLRIIGYQQISAPVEVEPNVVMVLSELKYIYKDRQVLRKIQDKHQWQYNSENGQWERVTPLPAL